VTTALILWWLSIGVGALAVVDCVRRPQSAWIAADRARSMWITWTVLASIFFLGIPMGLVYLFAIVPRFSQRSLTREFEKPGNLNQ
jgi:hypothetical protein